MGLFNDIKNKIINNVKDDLTYKARDAATNTVINGINKGISKIKGEKGTIKELTKCPKCKTKLEPDTKFCQSCGYKLFVNCKACSVDYLVGTKFCKQCGGKLV
jgi:hypothetical protein